MRKFIIIIPIGSLAILGIAAAVAFWLLAGSGDPVTEPADPLKHSLVRWELKHVLGNWLYEVGGLFRDRSLSGQEEDERLRAYFALSQEIAVLEEELARAPPAGAAVVELRARLGEKQGERLRRENVVEAIIEKRVGEVLSQEGLERSLPVLGFSVLWPPIDVEFDGPPQVLVVSPRHRIVLDKAVLLRNDVRLEDILTLEEEIEEYGVSALVVASGGVATYPSVVSDDVSYEGAVEVAAHEWLHLYLFFSPLGRRYFQSEELRIINETVASVAGREIAEKVLAAYPLLSGAGSSSQVAAEPPAVDFAGEMHQLRLAVDDLLSQGRVAEAERLMEEKRQFLAAHGYYIRKINQAYFAWHGTYADRPAASSPLGPKIIEIRQRSPSIGSFVTAMAQVTSAQDVDRLLAGLREATPP